MHNLLDEYYSDAELCEQFDITPRTSKSWRDQRSGPPVTYIKGKPHYRKKAARDWLLSREGKGRSHAA